MYLPSFFEEIQMFSEQASIVKSSTHLSLFLLLSFILCVLALVVPVEIIWFFPKGSFQIILVLINFFVLLYVLIYAHNFAIDLHTKASAKMDILACFSQRTEKAAEDMLDLERKGVSVFQTLLELRSQHDVKELFKAYETYLLKRHAQFDEAIQRELDGKGRRGCNPLPNLREERSLLEKLPSWKYFEEARRLKIGGKNILDSVDGKTTDHVSSGLVTQC